MKHHEAIAVAKDLKERLKKHIDHGEQLLKLEPSLEQYREVIRFNAVADEILSTYASPTTSLEDFGDTAIYDRVVSMESLLAKVSQFLKRSKAKAQDPKSSVTEQDYEHLYKREKFVHWLLAELPKLTENYQRKDHSIQLSKTASFIFKDIKGDVYKELKAEVDFLYRVGEQIKKGLQPVIAYHREFLNGVDPFIGKDDEADKLIAHLTKALAKQPKSFDQTFKGPSYTFLGAGKVEWFGEQSRERFIKYPKASAKDIAQVSVDYPDKETLQELGSLMFRIILIVMGYEEMAMSIPVPVDITEQPFRAYRDNPKVRELVDKSIFQDPDVDYRVYNPIEVITSLFYGLELALGEFIEKAVA